MTGRVEATGLGVRYGGVEALAGVDLSLPEGQVTGVIGPNGAGKTTLIDALIGFAPLTSGVVRLDGQDLAGVPPHRRAQLGMTRTFQGLELFDDLSVMENLVVAAEQCRVDRRVAIEVAEQLALRQHADVLAEELSPTQRKSLALARALVTRPRVLLLDEPAAGLDQRERTTLVELIKSIAAQGAAVMLVDHDLGLVMDACDHVVVLNLGRVVAADSAERVRRNSAVIDLYLGSSEVARQAPGYSAAATREVLRTHDLSAGYGGPPVIRDIDIAVRAGESVALLGVNGAGKTTVLRSIAGAVTGVRGRADVVGCRGPAAVHRLAGAGLAFVQQADRTFASLTVAENLRLADRDGGSDSALAMVPELIPLLSRRAGALSGGEQQLLSIAKAVARRPVLLLADEPCIGLSPQLAARVMTSLRALAHESAMAFVFADQHVQRALDHSDRGYVLSAGEIVLAGTSAELAAQPDRVSRAYLGA